MTSQPDEFLATCNKCRHEYFYPASDHFQERNCPCCNQLITFGAFHRPSYSQMLGIASRCLARHVLAAVIASIPALIVAAVAIWTQWNWLWWLAGALEIRALFLRRCGGTLVPVIVPILGWSWGWMKAIFGVFPTQNLAEIEVFEREISDHLYRYKRSKRTWKGDQKTDKMVDEIQRIKAEFQAKATLARTITNPRKYKRSEAELGRLQARESKLSQKVIQYTLDKMREGPPPNRPL